MDGIENQRDPGRPLDENVYEKPHLTSQHKLPENLLDALRNFEKCPVLRQGLGEEFVTAYLKRSRLSGVITTVMFPRGSRLGRWIADGQATRTHFEA